MHLPKIAPTKIMELNWRITLLFWPKESNIVLSIARLHDRGYNSTRNYSLLFADLFPPRCSFNSVSRDSITSGSDRSIEARRRDSQTARRVITVWKFVIALVLLNSNQTTE